MIRYRKDEQSPVIDIPAEVEAEGREAVAAYIVALDSDTPRAVESAAPHDSVAGGD